MLWLRLPLALALLFFTAFSGFGFPAAFEPNPSWRTWLWRIGYALTLPRLASGKMALRTIRDLALRLAAEQESEHREAA